MELQRKLEAILFATEEPLGITEISSILLEEPGVVKKELRKLIQRYGSENTSMEISSIGKKYRMILKSEYADVVKEVTKPELSGEQIKLLTLILNNDKTMRGEINEKFRGQSDHVIHSLKKLGFIRSSKYRNTEIFQLTSKFYKYFNIQNKRELKNTVNKDGEKENE